METYGRRPAREGSQPGLEEPMWQLGLGSGGSESYPERPDEADCIFYLRTGFCANRSRCRFNHPRDQSSVVGAIRPGGGEFPERVGQPVCQYYMRTGTCKFGATCKYHHPRQGVGSAIPVALNIAGYPFRPGEKECSYYLRTGQCKLGVTCTFHHPQPSGIQVPAPTAGPLPVPPPLLAPVYPSMHSPSAPSPQQYGVVPGNWPVATTPIYGLTQLSPSAPAYMEAYLSLSYPAGLSSSSQREHMFPERPGQPECQRYMKTGDCKFGSSCRFHHPAEWSPPKMIFALSPMGLPLRPGAPLCTHYAQNGVCKFGPSCKFDHPMGTLSYSPSASSLADMPVAPYPVGSAMGTLAPSSSSSELRPELASGSTKDALSTRMSSSMSSSSGSVGSIYSKSGPSSYPSVEQSGFPTPDEQNLSAPDLKSREEEDCERLQIQVRQYSDSTISISEHVGTSGTAPEGGVLSMEEFVVTEGQDLFPEDEESLTKLTDALSDVRVLSYTSTSMYTLPQYIFRLVALQKLFLRSCELLMMELPPEIGELKNLEVLDLEGTEILCLPMEIAKLVNLTCLKVSFYGYANQTVIPRGVLSNLLRLKELIIDVTPYGEWWDVEEVKAIIDDLHSLKELRTLKLYLPTAELLRYLTSLSPGLANFRFSVGRHKEHFISRLPRDVEEEFNNWEKLEKGLKFINGDCIPNEITKVFKHADAFFLQRHWTAKSLSEFGHANMNEVKFCLVMECNEFQTVIDSEQYYHGKDSRSESEDFLDFHETIVLGSLESLIIRYMKNMESIWKGPVGKGSLSNLKSLALYTCPILTTLFTVDMLINLTNLEEVIVEDCPKIKSLVSLKSTGSNSGLFLRSLKKISLLELPELVSISSGLWIAPNLERMVIFYCPKLEKLSSTEVSSTELKVIKGEKEWWDALKWYESDLSTKHEDYLARLFIPLRRDGDLMAQLTED